MSGRKISRPRRRSMASNSISPERRPALAADHLRRRPLARRRAHVVSFARRIVWWLGEAARFAVAPTPPETLAGANSPRSDTSAFHIVRVLMWRSGLTMFSRVRCSRCSVVARTISDSPTDTASYFCFGLRRPWRADDEPARARWSEDAVCPAGWRFWTDDAMAVSCTDGHAPARCSWPAPPGSCSSR